ncbi:hypothetical protein [Alkaliphilus crotonatoxidans]
MKRIISLCLVLMMTISLILTGCGKESDNREVKQGPGEEEKISENVAVDDDLQMVDITVPTDLIGDLNDFDEAAYINEHEGVEGAKINEDGTLTLTMTKAKHMELVEEMKQQLLDTLSDLKNSETTNYIKDIEYTEDFKEIKIIVEKAAYEGTFDLTPFIVGISVGMFQVYTGEEYNTTITVQDEATEEVLYSAKYPEVLEE